MIIYQTNYKIYDILIAKMKKEIFTFFLNCPNIRDELQI